MTKKRRLTRAKRAFSPVIAALILMLIAVASGVVAYAYVMGWLGGATTQPEQAKGTLQIDSIYATASTNISRIYVRNVGGKDLSLEKDVYINGVQFENTTTTAFTDGIITIAVQEVKYLEIFTADTMNFSLGYFYEVQVNCKDGTTISKSVEAK